MEVRILEYEGIPIFLFDDAKVYCKNSDMSKFTVEESDTRYHQGNLLLFIGYMNFNDELKSWSIDF